MSQRGRKVREKCHGGRRASEGNVAARKKVREKCRREEGR